jgi:heat shock protein HtpX
MYDQVVQNKRRSLALVLAFVAFTALVLIAVAYGLGLGMWGIAVAVILASVGAFAAYWKSDAIALATSRARPADPTEFARLHNLVEGLCIASGLPAPAVYVVDDPAPNAFATGRNPSHAAIAVTTGLLEKMNRVELEGVLAHELSHVKNYDTLVSTLAVIMVGVVALIADLAWRFQWISGGRRRDSDRGGGAGALLPIIGLVMLVLGPIVGRLMQFALSRKRE